ncbi:LysR family pca operon transcriptional activator [Roseibium hamelinense]|uniref:LysR family pca operon transcriptional activator n=1 Tax=Roseibium hamelinense TaxID=150831 RepID=A0A562T8R8_9HYPH|nr:pca operon transcription factor PcaQ [Roseibium hamelinense]MTI43499.1 pca operon transcription factor PcaQ [Roseibium hamelinense]TWI89708.1 LysR family pca operon transcriptional activator [Roseibium hamelinense]
MIDARVKYRHVQCFLEVSRRRSVVKAATALSITQPAVSKTLKELEDILEVRLLERSRRGVVLTQFGEVFQHYAAASLAALKQGLDSVAQARVSGESYLDVGVLPSVAASIVPEAVRQFQSEKIGTTLSLVTGPNTLLLSRLRMGELDLVVGRLADPKQMAGLSFQHLYSERVSFAVRAGHPLLGLPAAEQMARLPDYPVLFPTKEAIIRPYVERLMIAHSITVLPNRIETISNAFGRTFTLETDAVWIISSGVVSRDVEAGVLQELPLETTETTGPVGLTTRADIAPTPALLLFLSAIKSAAEAGAVKL